MKTTNHRKITPLNLFVFIAANLCVKSNQKTCLGVASPINFCQSLTIEQSKA